GHPDWALPSTAPSGVRTFLGPASHLTMRPARGHPAGSPHCIVAPKARHAVELPLTVPLSAATRPGRSGPARCSAGYPPRGRPSAREGVEARSIAFDETAERDPVLEAIRPGHDLLDRPGRDDGVVVGREEDGNFPLGRHTDRGDHATSAGRDVERLAD